MIKVDLHKVVFGYAVFSATLFMAFAIFFKYPVALVFYHLMIVGSILSAFSSLGILTYFLFGKNFQYRYFSFGFSVLVILLLLIFILNIGSNLSWGSNITIALIKKHFEDVGHLLSLLPASPVLFLLLFLAAFFFIYRVNAFVAKKINFEISLLYSFIFLCGSILLASSVGNLYLFSNNLVDKNVWAGEVITDLFSPYTTIELDALRAGGSVLNNEEALFSKGKRNNIIIIIVDSLRADHVEPYGYERKTTPFLSLLAKDANVALVENAYSMCSESSCGIISTLSSRSFKNQVTSNENLHTVLKRNGYKINLILSADHEWGALKESYSPYDLYVDGGMFETYATTDDRGVLGEIDKLPVSDGSPEYFYIHLMSSHRTGVRFYQHEIFRPNDGPHVWLERMLGKKSKLELQTNFYDNGIRQADSFIKEVLFKLEAKQYLQGSIIWIIGDHGEALNEHGYYGHVKGLHEEALKIPMIIVDKQGINQYEELFFATQLDVAPTILDRLGIDKPESWEGASLLMKKKVPSISTHFIPDRTNTMAKIAYIPEEGKILKHIKYDKSFLGNYLSSTDEFYEVISDPKERNNLLISPAEDINGEYSKYGFDF